MRQDDPRTHRCQGHIVGKLRGDTLVMRSCNYLCLLTDGAFERVSSIETDMQGIVNRISQVQKDIDILTSDQRREAPTFEGPKYQYNSKSLKLIKRA